MIWYLISWLLSPLLLTIGAAANDPTPEDTGTVPGEKPQEQEKERTFTQAELNKLLADEKRKAKEKYTDYDALKERAAKWAEYEESQKSELQKLTDALEAEKQKAQQAEQARVEALLQVTITAAAVKAGFHDPADAFALVDRTRIKIDDPETVTAAVADLAKAKPHLVKGTPPPPNPGATNPLDKKTEEGAPDWLQSKRNQGVSRGGVMIKDLNIKE